MHSCAIGLNFEVVAYLCLTKGNARHLICTYRKAIEGGGEKRHFAQALSVSSDDGIYSL